MPRLRRATSVLFAVGGGETETQPSRAAGPAAPSAGMVRVNSRRQLHCTGRRYFRNLWCDAWLEFDPGCGADLRRHRALQRFPEQRPSNPVPRYGSCILSCRPSCVRRHCPTRAVTAARSNWTFIRFHRSCGLCRTEKVTDSRAARQSRPLLEPRTRPRILIAIMWSRGARFEYGKCE